MDELDDKMRNALMVLAQGHRNDEAVTADTTLAETHSHSHSHSPKAKVSKT
jgi:hypothetical protein